MRQIFQDTEDPESYMVFDPAKDRVFRFRATPEEFEELKQRLAEEDLQVTSRRTA